MENPHVACLKNNSQGGMWIEASKVAQWLKYSVFFFKCTFMLKSAQPHKVYVLKENAHARYKPNRANRVKMLDKI